MYIFMYGAPRPPSDLPIFLLSAQVRSSAWTCRLELGFRVRVQSLERLKINYHIVRTWRIVSMHIEVSAS